MKNKIFGYVAIGYVAFVFRAFSDTSSNNNFIDKYHHEFNSDRTGNLIASQHFIKEVPATEQAEILAAILDRASAEQPPNYNIIGHVLGFLYGNSKSQEKIIWNEHLEKAIYAQEKSSNKGVRSEFVDLLAVTQREKAHDIILSFLNDPDEEVRIGTLYSIINWPDAADIYEKYIQSHQNNQDYAKSIQYAKNCLNTVRGNSK